MVRTVHYKVNIRNTNSLSGWHSCFRVAVVGVHDVDELEATVVAGGSGGTAGRHLIHRLEAIRAKVDLERGPVGCKYKGPFCKNMFK